MAVEVTLKNYRCFSDEHPAQFRLGDGISAFIGANHAGKSSLLKFFYEFRNLFARLANGEFVNASRGSIAFDYMGVADQTEVFCNLNSRDLTIELNPLGGLGSVDHFRLVVARGTNSATLYVRAGGRDLPGGQISGAGNSLSYGSASSHEALAPWADAMQFLQQLGQTTYVPAFRNAINVGAESPYFDIQAGQGFISNWHALKTGPAKASTEAILKLTNDIRELFKFPSLEINATSDGQSLQVIIGGRVYRLAEIGSGLVQFILTLGSVANRSSAYVLLDEPELNLHPSLQLAFVTTIASYGASGLCFATHSIGLARSSAERVYTIRRLSDGSSEIVPLEAQTSLAEFLGELGYLGYREMGFDRILLVEGPKDLKAVQQILRMYGKDDKVLLLPLGGNSGINAGAGPQLSELLRVSGNVAAIIDSEKMDRDDSLEAPREAFRQTCTDLNP